MENKKGKAGVFFRRLMMAVCCIVLSALVYLGCVLLGNGEEMRPLQEDNAINAVTRLQAGDFTDPALLKDSFGAPLPYWEQVSLSGETRNHEQHGETVRRMEARFENGCIVRAATPQTAASLVWEKQNAEIAGSGTLHVSGAPVLMAVQEDGYHFGFVLNETYYAVFVPQTDAEAAHEVFSQMIWLY